MLLTSLVIGWKDSFSLLKWSEFKLIVLLILNSARRSVRLLVRYALPLIALAVILHAWANPSWRDFLYESEEQISKPLMIVATFAWMVMMLVTCLTVRASLEHKDADYYRKYVGRLPFFLLLAIVPAYYSLIPVLWLTAFFFLDDANSLYTLVRALFNGFKMCLFYLPLMLSVMLPFLFVYCSFDQLLNVIMPASLPLAIFNGIRFLGFYCIDVLLLSAFSICYLKVKHSQYQLFFRVKAAAK